MCLTFELDQGRATHNYIIIVLDSCRFDSKVIAAPGIITETGPSSLGGLMNDGPGHHPINLRSGLLRTVALPTHWHLTTTEMSSQYNECLRADGVQFKSFVPSLYLPLFLKEIPDYLTHATSILPST